MNWTIESSNVSGFASSWNAERTYADCSTQCGPVTYANTDSQCPDLAEKETQTAKVTDSTPPPADPSGGRLLPSFVSSVMRASALILPALEQSLNSTAIDNFARDVDKSDAAIQLEHTVCVDQLGQAGSPVGSTARVVTCVSVNCRSNVVAVGVSDRSVHTSWCSHPGQIHLYTLNSFVATLKTESVRLEVRSCVSHVQFHPREPHLLLAGLHSGEILLCDIDSSADWLVWSSVSVVDSHREPISALVWRSRDKTRDSVLSASSDGCLLLWQRSQSRPNLLKLAKRFKLLAPRQARGPVYLGATELGATVLACCPHDSDLFAVGSESGPVAACTLSNKISVGDTASDVFNPLQSLLSHHSSHVLALNWSAMFRYVLVSVSADDTLAVWNILQATPLMTVTLSVSVVSVAICERRPLLVFATTAAGGQYLLEASNNGCVCETVCSGEEREPTSALSTAIFAPHVPSMLVSASGDTVCVWRISDRLVDCPPAEKRLLASLNDLASGK